MSKVIEIRRRAVVQGILSPIGWDEVGEPCFLAVLSLSGEVFLLAESAQAEDLIEYIGAEVEVRGDLRLDEHRRRIVNVETIDVWQDEESDDDDGEGDDDQDDPDDEDDPWDATSVEHG